MSAPYFNTPERIQALMRSAAIWPGTPFAHYGAVPGKEGGVSCHCLVHAVITGAGYVFKEELPRARVNWARSHTGGLMLPWLRARGIDYQEIPPKVELIQPGDILIFNIGLCEHHMGVALPDAKVLHAMPHAGAHISGTSDPSIRSRLAAIFRPLDQ